MTTPRRTKPTRFKWHKGRERWDAVHCGEPDFFAYMIRYWSQIWKSAVWAWTLTTPRGGRETAHGWASSAHAAKREVEAKIEEIWR